MVTSFPYSISGHDLWNARSRMIAEAEANHVDLAEVDWLLRDVCQIDPLALRLGTLAKQSDVPSRWSLAKLTQQWQQRIQERVPIQHLVGKTPWRSFTLRVSPAVLIPRPETELIIDLAVAAVEQSPHPSKLKQGTWVDMGTGSGAIALGLAVAFPNAHILAVDVSSLALEIAQRNAEENGLGDRIQFFQGSWFEPLIDYSGKLAGIVSNPPYIPHEIIPTLQLEVVHHEPHLALDGGNDGLDAIRQLVERSPNYLHPGGLLITELMIDQAPTVVELLSETHAYTSSRIAHDLAGIDRFVYATRK